MKIIVDGMSARVGGGLSFLIGQLSALEDQGAKIEILTAPWNDDDFGSRLRSPRRRVPVPNVAARFAYEQVVMPFTASADVLYCPGNFIPLLAGVAPRVLCVQNPNYFGRGRALQQNLAPSRRLKIALSRASVRRAEATVVISNALHSEIVQDGLGSGRLHVVRSGAPSWDIEPEPPDMALERPFFLSLANDYPHKRLGDVIEGWSLAKSRGGDDFPTLVLAGSISHPRRRQLADIPGPGVSRDDLGFAGSVRSRGQTRWLLENCIAVISTSELEALPLVPLEAASLGTPALLSDIPPHRETAEGYGVFFGVGDLSALAVGLLEAASDRVRPPPLVWPISWQDNARQLMGVFEHAAASRRDRSSLVRRAG